MPLIPVKNHKSPRKAAQSANAMASALLAPTDGLNFRDPFITLGPKDAVVLENFVAQPTGCVLRDGYKQHVTGLGGVVNSFMGYLAQDSEDSKLFAAVGADIFDVTASAEAPTAIETTSSTDGVWSSIMFSAPTQNFLCCTSASGGYWTYDAAGGWVDRLSALTGFVGNPGSIAAWKNRLFITAAGTNKVYYLPVNSIQGAASELDFGPLMKHGGHIVGIVNWTLNAGLDIDDYFVVFGSQGDILVYQGTDPDDVSTFAIKGIWYMGRPPVGDRFFCEYGGELFVLTELGLLPLSKMVNGQVANTYSVMSSKIQPVLSPQLARLINQPTWSVMLAENNDVLMICPPKEKDQYRQYVMYIQTGAWSTFTGLPINSTTTYNGQMYFGDEDGTVYLGLSGDTDNADINGLGGDSISGQAQGAFNNFGSPANLKLFNMARPILIASQPPAVQAQMNIEYTFSPVYASLSYTNLPGGVWDEDLWNEATWAGDINTYAAWVGLQGMGYYGSLRVAVKGKPGTTYVSSTVMYQPGGVM
jgi:hypothetical protein